jgi:uncharacterized protein (DUF1684 family)
MTEARAAARDPLSLLDWRRRVFDLYREVRADPDRRRGWQRWRDVRDALVAHHPQSPLDETQRAAFAGLAYFDYDPELRVLASVRSLDGESHEIPVSHGEPFRFTRFAEASFELDRPLSLELYWLEAYGGGVFLSFSDATSGDSTYGAGRYLLDTVKGADLGMEGDRLVLDFNFAYHPSCALNPRWACPLAPPTNRLPIAVRGGERLQRPP